MNDENVVQEDGGVTERALVGKIARLPKAIREQVNRRLEDGQPTSVMVPWLNELPAVKKVMATYFGGVEINHRNISNWRATGYKRWVERQEILAEVKELAEEAADINATSADGLMRMTATLACTKLLRALRDEKASAGDVVKIGFAIAALNNVELSRVRVEHEERRLEQKDELVTLAWDKHLRDCAAIALRVLNDAQAKAVQQAPINNEAKIELIGRRMFGKLWRGRKVGAGEGEQPQKNAKITKSGEEDSEALGETPNATRETRVLPISVSEGEQPQENTKITESCEEDLKALGGTPNTATGTVALPISVDERNNNEDLPVVIADEPSPHPDPLPSHRMGGEREQQGASVSGSESPRHAQAERPTEVSDATQDASTSPVQPNAQNSTLPKPMLSDYEKAIVEGKTPLEAMYAQFTRPKDPPPPREPIPCEPPYRYYAMSRQPDPPLQRPPPEWNSLG